MKFLIFYSTIFGAFGVASYLVGLQDIAPPNFVDKYALEIILVQSVCLLMCAGTLLVMFAESLAKMEP